MHASMPTASASCRDETQCPSCSTSHTNNAFSDGESAFTCASSFFSLYSKSGAFGCDAGKGACSSCSKADCACGSCCASEVPGVSPPTCATVIRCLLDRRLQRVQVKHGRQVAGRNEGVVDQDRDCLQPVNLRLQGRYLFLQCLKLRSLRGERAHSLCADSHFTRKSARSV
jgi:hypothetical protein